MKDIIKNAIDEGLNDEEVKSLIWSYLDGYPLRWFKLYIE